MLSFTPPSRERALPPPSSAPAVRQRGPLSNFDLSTRRRGAGDQARLLRRPMPPATATGQGRRRGARSSLSDAVLTCLPLVPLRNAEQPGPRRHLCRQVGNGPQIKMELVQREGPRSGGEGGAGASTRPLSPDLAAPEASGACGLLSLRRSVGQETSATRNPRGHGDHASTGLRPPVSLRLWGACGIAGVWERGAPPLLPRPRGSRAPAAPEGSSCHGLGRRSQDRTGFLGEGSL